MQDDDLKKSTVIRAGQRPPMILFVPMNVFFIETGLMFLVAKFIGMWVFALIPLHIIPVVWTAKDLFWTRTMDANRNHWWFASNKDLKAKNAVTFTAAAIHKKSSD